MNYRPLCLGFLGLAAWLTACDKPESNQLTHSDLAQTEAVSHEISPFLFNETRATSFRLLSRTQVSSQPTSTDLELSGTLALLPQDSIMRAVVLDARVLLNGKQEPVLTSKLRAMEAGAVWSFTNGQLESLKLPKDLSPEASNFWRTLASAFQYVSPAGESARLVEQYDSTGKHKAEYAFANQVLTRKKLAYVEVLQSGPTVASLQQLEPQILSSKTEMHLKQGLVERLTQNEGVSTELQKGVTLRVDTDFSLEGLRGLSTEDDAALLLKSGTFGSGFQSLESSKVIALSKKIDQSQFDEVRMKDWTFDEALQAVLNDQGKRVDKSAQSDDQKKRTYSAYSALTAYLRSVPTTLQIAEGKMWSDREAAAALLGPLRGASTPAAQKLLLRFAEDGRIEHRLRSVAIIEVAQVDEPIPEMAMGLTRLIEVPGLERQALLNLGTLGRKFREAGRVEEFDQVSTTIQDRLQAAKDMRSSSDALSAASNLGDERLLKQVRPYLDAEVTVLRGDAVLALRHMRTLEADPLIAAAMNKEKTKLSLFAVITAMEIRQPLPMHQEALRTLLARPDLERQVRARAQHLLDSWKSS